MSNGPNVQGQISLDTKALDKAVKEIKRLEQIMFSSSNKITKSSENVAKALGKVVTGLSSNVQASQKTAQATAKIATEQKKATAAVKAGDSVTKANIKAINSVENSYKKLEERLKRSKMSEEQKAQEIVKANMAMSKAIATIAKYNSSSLAATKAVVGFKTAVTDADVAMSKQTRIANQLAKSQSNVASSTQTNTGATTANINAISRVELAYQKLEGRIKASALSDEEKTVQLRRVKGELNNATRAIDMYGSRSANAAKQIAILKRETTAASIATTNANRAFRGQQIVAFKKNMDNLASSVSLALGPLNGVASRIIAFKGILNRNTAAVTALVGAFTALSITMARSLKASIAAETSFLRMESIINGMGVRASATAQQIFDMGASIGMATLTSTQEARDAGLLLAGFSGIAVDSFERIITTAQGVSDQFGGNLVDNTKNLARALQDPVGSLSRLERRVGDLSVVAKEQIEVFMRQGDLASAQAVVLGELSAQYKLATDSAKGLAGSLDSTGELMTKLYETIGLTSGATKEAANQVNRFNKTLQDFIASDAATAMGQTLVNAIKVLGNAFNFLAENADTFGLILTALMGGVIVKTLGGMVKLTGILLGTTKAFVGFGGAVGVAMKSARPLVTLLSSMNPWMIAIKVAALALAPALGFMVKNFITSSNSAETLTDRIGKLDKSVEGLLKTSKDLADWNLNVAPLINDLQETRDAIDSLSDSVETTESRMAEINVKKLFGDQLAASVENANELTRALSQMGDSSFDLMSVSEELRPVLVNLNRGFGLNSKATRDLMTEYLELATTANKNADELAELELISGILEEQITDLNEETRESIAAFDKHTEATRNLKEEYDKQHQNLKQLEADYNSAVSALEYFISVQGNGTKEAEGAGAQIEALRRVIKQLKEEMEDAANEMNEMSNAVLSLQDTLGKARNEAIKLRDEFMGWGTDSLTETDYAVQAISRSVAELSGTELEQLAQSLDTNFDRSTMTLEQYRVAVVGAYAAQYRAALESKNATELLIESQDLLKDSLPKSQITALVQEYKTLSEAASSVAAGGGVDRTAEVEAWFAKEKELLMRHTSEMKQFDWLGSTDDIQAQRESRAEALAEMWADEEEQYNKHLAEMNKAADNAQVFAAITENAQFAADGLDSIMQTMQIQNREQTKEYKAIAKAQVMIASGVAIAKAIASAAENPIKALASASMIGFQMGAQLAAIDNAYATGGYVSGSGTATSDSVPAMLSDGEYVINARAVRMLGLGNLDALNSGQVPKGFAEGGPVTAMPIPMQSSGSSGGVNIQIIDQRSDRSSPITTEETSEANGQKNIRILVRDAVREEMSRGSLDTSMAQNYGVTRKPKRR